MGFDFCYYGGNIKISQLEPTLSLFSILKDYELFYVCCLESGLGKIHQFLFVHNIFLMINRFLMNSFKKRINKGFAKSFFRSQLLNAF